MYKCVTHLIPVNLTAGECCDRCARATDKSTTTTKKLTMSSQKTSPKLEKTKSSSSSSEEEDNNSSSEELDKKPLGCNIRPLNPKPIRRRKFHLLSS
jgi:hypothetical protein